jgi:hypothetical protein
MRTSGHAAAMFRILGGGNAGDLYEIPNEQLAIIPGTTNVTMVDQNDLLIPVITKFLQTPLVTSGCHEK